MQRLNDRAPARGGQLAPRIPVPGVAPGCRGFIATLKAFRASGGTAPDTIVGSLMEEHGVGDAAYLAHLIHARHVFGFEWRGSVWIPMFQFDHDCLSVKPGPRQVRSALPADWSGWALAAWFADRGVGLQGGPPVDLLESDFAAVLDAAHRDCASHLKATNASPYPFVQAQLLREI
jgi:hypothetical protein